MPGEHLTTGFFGKIPATGDFVAWNLPRTFIDRWDRWIARNLAGPLSVEPLEMHPTLRFMLAPTAGGPMAGVVMASADRAGRCFPLTIAAPLPLAAAELAVVAAKWFDEIEEAGDAARCGELGVDELAQRLAALPFPSKPAQGDPVQGMTFWIDPSDTCEADPDAPRETLDYLLARYSEAC